MARGKKTSPEAIYRIMVSWAVTQNLKETAKTLEIPVSTVKKVVDEHRNDDEFVKLCNEKKNEFSEKASIVIEKALNRLERDIENDEVYIPVNHLANAIGILFDKKALAEGKPTERTEIIDGNKLNKLAELAGYERKQ